jgi:hypothetical protein
MVIFGLKICHLATLSKNPFKQKRVSDSPTPAPRLLRATPPSPVLFPFKLVLANGQLVDATVSSYLRR